MRAIMRLEQEAEMPRWYRLAYVGWDGDRLHWHYIAAWLGLHWLVRFAHRVWEWSYRYSPSGLEREREGLRGRVKQALQMCDAAHKALSKVAVERNLLVADRAWLEKELAEKLREAEAKP